MQEFVLPYSDRFALKFIKGRKILDDTYNSSLESLRTAAESIEKIKAKKKIAVIGSIFDQGKYSEESHKKIMDYLYPFDMILIYDSDKQIDIIKEYRGVKFVSDDPVEISKWLLKNTFEEDLIYFKASRAVRIEDIINVFKESE
jgi:UDP-N-acetylmuramoyl-tripeptide--D-alanyl-D-alanine ligase